MPVRPALTTGLALAAGFTIAACIVQAPPQQPQQQALPSNQAEASGAGAPVATSTALANGAYACALYTDGFQYPPFPCTVYAAEDGSQVLEKTGGSQRIRGKVSAIAGGFHFDGQFYCPYGDCTTATSGDFVAVQNGQFRGSLATQNSATTVTLTFMPGGMAYGGAMYGAMYGGMAYGGAAYGGTVGGGANMPSP